MIICGIDEAGRGPLAGPVTAAAVILPKCFPINHLDDSKALSRRAREEQSLLVRQNAQEWSIGWAWPLEIDRINIHHATLLDILRLITATILISTRDIPRKSTGHYYGGTAPHRSTGAALSLADQPRRVCSLERINRIALSKLARKPAMSSSKTTIEWRSKSDSVPRFLLSTTFRNTSPDLFSFTLKK